MKKKRGRPVGVLKQDNLNIFEANRRQNSRVVLDIGCGGNKQPGALGVDFRSMPGVDIVQDLTMFPWRAIPDEIADVVMASHVLEHINPASSNPQLAGLLDLLLDKGLVTQREVDAKVGEYRFLGGFIRFMDEIWRVLKPGGQLQAVFPFAGSPGYWQDLTHLNGITPTTLAYLDPLSKVEGTNQYYGLYAIYRPKPWQIVKCFYDTSGFIETALSKRLIDKSYGVSSDNGMKS